MGFETIVLTKKDNIATLTLNRPDRRNAINRKMMEELGSSLADIAADDSIRALIITGAGKSFCSGADLDLMPAGSGENPLADLGVETLRRSFIFQASKKVILSLHQMEKPTIAMINGACVGAGFDLALACDMKIASDKAKFLCGFVKIGLFPGFGAAWLYPRTMGLSKAIEMLFTGDILYPQEAKEIGMLNKVTTPEELETETVALARKVADGPPIAIRLMKAQVYKGLGTDLNTALDEAAMCEAITLVSKDHPEGVVAMLEKRAPKFTGN